MECILYKYQFFMDENILNIAIQYQCHCDMFTKTHYGILATTTGRRCFIRKFVLTLFIGN